MEVSPLREEHDYSKFSSGVAPLDEYLQHYAGINERRGISRTYVATEGSDSAILGFVTILVGAVACEDLPAKQRRGLPRYPVPVLHIGRLAVDKRARGQGLGKRLLMHALEIALQIADQAGLLGVEVIAKDEQARAFYERFGFKSLADDELHLYVSLKTLRKAFA